jgi:hypothetical protein
MSNNTIALISQIELDLIEAYLSNGPILAFDDFFSENQIPDDAMASQLQIAVARVLLNSIQGSLPQWAGVRENGELVLNRKEIQRHPDATKLTLNPRLVCCINWADSGPGFSWPESYHLTYIPGFEKFIVTSSRDGADAFGCADHALGWGAATEGELLVAKRVVQGFWEHQRNEWDQERWAYLFDEGLINRATANSWAEEIWPQDNDSDEDEDEESDD